MVISQRMQTVFVLLFVLVIGSATAVLLTRFERTPAVKSPSGDPNVIDSSAKGPVGGVILTAGTGDLVVRFITGSCKEPGGPKLELSKNKGRSFRQIRIPQFDDGSGVSGSSPAVQAISWAQATSLADIEVAAADSKCHLHMYSTKDSGLSWQQSDKVDVWYKDPLTEGVVAPSGPVDAGCKQGVVSVMPITKKKAKVVCAKGTFRTTTDGGTTWLSAGRLPGTSVAAFTGPMTGYASVAEAKCKSRIYATVDGGLTWLPKGCVAREFIMPALSGTEKRLVTGGSAGTLISTDGGASWDVAPVK